MLTATETAYRVSIQSDMPGCSYQHFCLWALEPENPHRTRFVQITGIRQLAHLTAILLDGLAEHERDWQHLLTASMTMNAWQVHEIVSDNLAIGLGHPTAQTSDPLKQRRALLSTFNTLLVEQLAGDARPTAEQATLLQVLSPTISLFEHSLAPHQHRLLASTYIHEHSHHKLTELEYSAWAPLIANITTCAAVVRAIGMDALRTLMCDSLVRRYQGVSRLLQPIALTLPELLDISTDTILVIPTLAYYIAALLTATQSEAALTPLIEDGTIGTALYSTARLVRLLNDLGTHLLTLHPARQQALIRQLARRLRAHQGTEETLVQFLARTTAELPGLSRVHKDAVHDEVNVALYGLGHLPASTATLDHFEQNLALCTASYTAHQERLHGLLERISTRLDDGRVSQLLRRFVRFHEHLYSQPYNTTVGEYAI